MRKTTEPAKQERGKAGAEGRAAEKEHREERRKEERKQREDRVSKSFFK
jgi:hypothetical protein